MATVLVIDDDQSYLDSMTSYLRLKGHDASGFLSAPQSSRVSGRYDIVLLDIALAERDGFDVLGEYVAAGIPVAMVSGNADARNAVRAVKAGAIDVLEKPVDLGRLEVAIALAESRSRVIKSERAARDAWLAEHLFVGSTPAMKDLVAAAERAASTDLAVLLHGPSGTGKDPLARWIHARSHRCDGPFVIVNCAAIPSSLAESELFGHRRGAFTGADRDRNGCFAEASGGTLFLDEVGELPSTLQPKLLRAIETGEYRPVGADATFTANVRIVSATNRDLKAEASRGVFREDLLYRLGQVPLAVPPLSARVADVPGLVSFFTAASRIRAEFAPDALEYLSRREYPGNVRELKSVVERALALCAASDQWRISISGAQLESLDAMGWNTAATTTTASSGFTFAETMPLREAKRRMELIYLEQQIAIAGGSLARAAERLSVLPNNLSRRLSELRDKTSTSSDDQD
ncbi:MAG: sigma-54-dependent Fis family transcriptional regulator [Spirochaetales bacterium]|nr:sigma-54-dependent Fis family transcriptional regulator [Spirochaetales bacterium]